MGLRPEWWDWGQNRGEKVCFPWYAAAAAAAKSLQSCPTLCDLGIVFHNLGNFNYFSVQFSCSVVSDSLRPHESQHARPPCPSPTPGVYSLMSIESVMPSNHLILCHPILLLPSIFPNIRVFSNESVLCISIGCESIGVSASVSVLPMNIQDWFPLGWTGWISSQSKGLSRVFSNTTVQKSTMFSCSKKICEGRTGRLIWVANRRMVSGPPPTKGRGLKYDRWVLGAQKTLVAGFPS